VAEKKKVKPVAPPSAEASRNAAVVNALLGAAANSKVKNVQGVLIEDLKIGSGKVAARGNRIKVHYVGKLKSNGNTFDACTKKPFPFRLGAGEVIRGWDIGCEGMAIGGKRRLTIPPEKAYGRAGAPPTIPGNATLVFDVTLLEV
jgi:FK506-binding nuclear protein